MKLIKKIINRIFKKRNNVIYSLEDNTIHRWFGLSYSNYLVLHRTVMESMDAQWQEDMVRLLNEIEEKTRHLDIPSNFLVKARDIRGKFIKDKFSNYRRPCKEILNLRKGE